MELNNENLSQNIKTVKDEIKEASKAKKICDETISDYTNYKEYSKKEKKFQEENKKLQKNIEKRNKLTHSLGNLETSLKLTSKQIEEVNKKSGNLPELEEKFLRLVKVYEKTFI